LLRANHELTLAAKTSALGAVTAHLLHELKNPLFGLQSFVSVRSVQDEDDTDWLTVAQSTQRMHKMISDVVAILQEENHGAEYELSLREVLEVVVGKLQSCDTAKSVQMTVKAGYQGLLSSKDGNLIVLILTNLAQNALQAMPDGGAIEFSAFLDREQVVFSVEDTGPGIPEHIRKSLFTPIKSSKRGGTGVGLAISHQLARHLGGELLLARTSSSGSVFQLRLAEATLLNPPVCARDAFSLVSQN
jgi:signal transduction histidine kinase